MRPCENDMQADVSHGRLIPLQFDMRSIDAVIFDLDGTLWDTTETCVRAWNRVLDRHAIAHRSVTLDDMRSVTGKAHRECIATVFAALTPDEIDLLVRETETEDNAAVQEEGGLIYPGVAEGLARLQRRWIRC